MQPLNSIPSSAPKNQSRWHIFCRVVDNYGDIGVCWRLAKQLAQEHKIAVTLWVDDLVSFNAICPPVNPRSSEQTVVGIGIRQWPTLHTTFTPDVIPDVIIEAFACELPAHYRLAMQQKWQQHSTAQLQTKRALTTQAFAWINLEYLSAEPWVESCHLSPSPVEGMRKTFFFPGFSAKTGGLMFDHTLIELGQKLQQPREQQAAIERLCQRTQTPTPPQAARHISLFAYPNAPIKSLIDALMADNKPTQLWLLGDNLNEAMAKLMGHPVVSSHQYRQGHLNITCLPMLAQNDYDLLLALADFNCVRGEESFVRAQMLGKPMLWHIYPQEEHAHHDKLDAFLNHYCDCDTSDNTLNELIKQLHQLWNGVANPEEKIHYLNQKPWPDTLKLMTQWQEHAKIWQQKLLNNGDLTTKLVRFCSSLV
ncbi:MAG: elongation factor P maturation arginine rhamnosyltransferase EarP [Marinagarivorans sp.]|nr:elongation factor P maturation arginine rhamnosyltransferase EarP [Marinagarivorans sp.]